MVDKRKRTALTLAKKLLNGWKTAFQLAKEYGVGKSTITDTKIAKQKLEKLLSTTESIATTALRELCDSVKTMQEKKHVHVVHERKGKGLSDFRSSTSRESIVIQ